MRMNFREMLLAQKLFGGSGGSGGSGGADAEFVRDIYVESNRSNPIGYYLGLKIDFLQAETIGYEAWNNCEGLESVILRKAKTVESRAFIECPMLTSVSAPKLTSIGEMAFAHCVRLTTLDLPAVTSIGVQAFQSCGALTTLVLPSSTSIGELAFADCYSLTSVNLPVATSIGGMAFRECTNLTSVDLPVVTSIGGDAFWRCTNLSTLILRNPETVCQLIVSAVLGTKIVTAEGAPTGEGFIYVPTALYEGYVELLAYQAAMMLVSQGMGEAEAQATAEYIARAVLRKIEDYPEICGT